MSMKITLRKLLSTAFAATLCLSASSSLVACGSSVKSGEKSDGVKGQNYVSHTLTSFESVAEIETLGSFGELGKIGFNQDKQYVSDGTASLKVLPSSASR